MSEEIRARASQLLEDTDVPACEMVARYQELKKLKDKLPIGTDLRAAIKARCDEFATKLFGRRACTLATPDLRTRPSQMIVEPGRYRIELNEDTNRSRLNKYRIDIYYYSSEGCFDFWKLILDHASELKFLGEDEHYPMLFAKDHTALAIMCKNEDKDYRHDASGSCFYFPNNVLDEFFPLPEDIEKKGHCLCYYPLIAIKCPDAAKLVQDFNAARDRYEKDCSEYYTLVAAEKALHKRDGNTDDLDAWTNVMSLLPSYWLDRETAEKKYHLNGYK